MTVTLNFHHLAKVEHKTSGEYSWVEIEDGKGNSIALHVDYRLAEMLAEAFHDWDSYEPEPPTYDEALGAKIDRATQLYRQMRDAGRL